MKSVLISIQPKWCDLIASGEKTIEVRKTRPKIETPFKCYIYMTKNGNSVIRLTEKGNVVEVNYKIAGKVIGEFACDRIICSQAYFDSQGKNHLTNVFEEDIKRTCLTEYELWYYIAGKAVKANQIYDGYLWHITDLKIYDKPKELGEFRKPWYYKLSFFLGEICDYWDYPRSEKITSPPQSWCYVEE